MIQVRDRTGTLNRAGTLIKRGADEPWPVVTPKITAVKLKGLIFKIAVFGIGLTVALQLLGVFVSANVEELYFDKMDFDWRWLAAPKVNPNVVFMGASTTRYGISPSIVADSAGFRAGEVINLSYDAVTPAKSLRIGNELLAVHHHVEVVFYGIEPWVMSDRYYQFDDLESLHWSILQRIYATLKPIVFPHPKDKLLKKNHFLNLDAVLTTAVNNFGRRHVENDNPPEDFGGVTRTGHLDDSAPSEEVCRAYSPASLFKVSEFYFQRLSELKRLVEHAGAQFVIIIPPLSKVVRTEYERDCGSRIDVELIEAIRKYLGPVAVIHGSKLFQMSPDSINFADPVHLNSVGRKLFSLFIANQLTTSSFRPEMVQTLDLY